MIRRIIGVVACWAAAFAAHAQVDTFPRLGALLMGDPRNYEDADYQADIAKVDVAIMSVWPGWEVQRSVTFEEVLKRIKARNPNIKIFHYFMPESILNPANPVFADLNAKIDANKWWLYTSGSGPTKVLSDFGRDTYILNQTMFTPKDSSSKRLNEWLPNYAYDVKVKPYPSLDGIFSDNIFWKPRRNGDWNRDGKVDDQNDSTVQKWYREGNAMYVNSLKKVMPGKLQIANIGDWGQPDAVLTEYGQLLHGGVMEGLIGASYSIESRQGWTPVIERYRKSMKALADPKLGIFHQMGDKSDFQAFRYGFATALLDDGYYAFSEEKYSGVPWFDEYDVKLGRATSSPPTSAWQHGVWRRDFENGVALVNPKGNGSVEVTLERAYRKIAGKQDRAVNNGEAVSKIRLRDRDGMVLLRMQKRPRAPGSVNIDKAP